MRDGGLRVFSREEKFGVEHVALAFGRGDNDLVAHLDDPVRGSRREADRGAGFNESRDREESLLRTGEVEDSTQLEAVALLGHEDGGPVSRRGDGPVVGDDDVRLRLDEVGERVSLAREVAGGAGVENPRLVARGRGVAVLVRSRCETGLANLDRKRVRSRRPWAKCLS